MVRTHSAMPVLCNSLPEHFRTCNNFNQFKQLISNYTGKDCKCVICKTEPLSSLAEIHVFVCLYVLIVYTCLYVL